MIFLIAHFNVNVPTLNNTKWKIHLKLKWFDEMFMSITLTQWSIIIKWMKFCTLGIKHFKKTIKHILYGKSIAAVTVRACLGARPRIGRHGTLHIAVPETSAIRSLSETEPIVASLCVTNYVQSQFFRHNNALLPHSVHAQWTCCSLNAYIRCASSALFTFCV